MELKKALNLVKASLGISTAVRDTFLTAVILGVINELKKENGVKLDDDNPNHLMFVVDYSAWRYESRAKGGAMPRDLQFRLHNLIVNAGGNRGI